MRMSRWIMVALFAVSAVVVVEAQQPRQPGGGFGAVNLYTSVLSNKDLQAELKVTDEQKEKFKAPSEKVTEMNKKRGEIFKSAGMDRDKLKEAFADFTKESEKVNADVKKSVEEILTADQKKRIGQLEVQVKGMGAFTDEKIAKELSITDAQTSKIKGIVEEYRNDTKDLGGFGGGGNKGGFDKEKAAENQKKRDKLRKAALADIEDTLTADQKTKWKEMTGEPFDTTKLFGGFGGGFTRPGGGTKGKEKTKD